MIIGISGKIKSGKNTVATIINDLTNKRFEEKMFASKLKDIVCMLIGCTREQLEDQDFKNKELGEEWWFYRMHVKNSKNSAIVKSFSPIPYIKNKSGFILEQQGRLHLHKHTPRSILQILGTNAGRDLIHPNIWVNSLMSEYQETEDYAVTAYPTYSYPKWIITDMRFSNELEAIKSRKGITIRVNRNIPIPEFEHESETALDNAEFDHVIENNGTMDELIDKVRNILLIEKIL